MRPCNKLPAVLKQKVNILFPYIIFILAMDKYAICDRCDIGPPGTSVPTHEIEIVVSSTDQTKIYISLFTIKKKHAVACCPRVSTSHLRKTTVCDVATLTNIPNSLREYRLGLCIHPTPTPQEVLLVLFFQEKNRKTPHKLTSKKEKAQP